MFFFIAFNNHNNRVGVDQFKSMNSEDIISSGSISIAELFAACELHHLTNVPITLPAMSLRDASG